MFGGDPTLPVGEAGRVDHQRRTVAEPDHVGRVPEPVVDDAVDLDHGGLRFGHAGFVAATTM
jgi:hypothetical protein